MNDFSFITVGEFVHWNDPAGETSGIYEVNEIRKSGKVLASDDIVLISDSYSEAEVMACELQPHQIKENKSFAYCDHTFIGLDILDKKKDWTTNLSNCCGSVTCHNEIWNTKEFLKMSNQHCLKPYDIFLMDDKYAVIPVNNYLSFWGKNSYNRYQSDAAWRKKAEALQAEYAALLSKSIELLKEYVDDNGEQAFNESDGIAVAAEYHEGWIVEEVIELTQSADNSIVLETASGDEFGENSRHDLLPSYMKILKTLSKTN